jgi:hypothetical protein
MHKILLQTLLVYLFIIPAFSLCAQTERDTIPLFQVVTADGNEYTGIITAQDTSVLILQTEKLGTLTLSKKDIVRIQLIEPEKLKEGIYWADNPQSTRYLWAPNGYGLKKGEAYYQNIWVLFNQVSFGVSNNFSVGAGMIPLFLFAGTSTPAWITPKFSIPVKKDKFNLGAGALLATVLGESKTGFGLLYGIATFGSRDRNLSVGLGYGYAGGSLADSPTVSMSGLIRIGARSYIITENYYIDGGYDTKLILASAGFRWIIKKAGLDFGLVLPYESSMESVFFIPWLGITIPFGNR